MKKLLRPWLLGLTAALSGAAAAGMAPKHLKAVALPSVHSLGIPDEEFARESVERLALPSDQPEVWLPKIRQLWTRKCEPARPGCFLEECDLLPGRCSPDRVLLFRGNTRDETVPALSAMVRAHWRGSAYLPDGDAHALLRQLKNDIARFRPASEIPDMAPVMAIRPFPLMPAEWVYVESPETPFVPMSTGSPLSLLQILTGFHAQSSYLSYQDARFGRVSIDPLISFSASPLVAGTFAHQDRVVILSVPRRDFHRDCGEELPEPGTLIDASNCDVNRFYTAEREYDALLYVRPDYVFRSYFLRN